MSDVDLLLNKIKVLSEEIWEGRASGPELERWLAHFEPDSADCTERAHALFLLSQFVYFGSKEIRALLRSLYRDQFKYPIVEKIRRETSNTTDADFIAIKFRQQLEQTVFLGVGNPAESGTHLLYFFRQENDLPKSRFASLPQLVNGSLAAPDVALASPGLSRFVFIDDFCGSGDTAMDCSRAMIPVLRGIAERAGETFEISYLVLVGNEEALETVRRDSDFDVAEAVFELDASYKSVSPESKIFSNAPPGLTQPYARAMALRHGKRLTPAWPLGYEDGELLLGFHHNVPDNSLPILWSDHKSHPWSPIFPRFRKV